jgi:release factor glutamine methyltransferase
MLTVLESINLSSEYLKKKGIESPRINAELLLAKILNCKRIDLYLSFDRPLSEEETFGYREFIKRRSGFEPLQYITGSVEFYGMEFKVNNSVLIPRPETELLVETVIEEFKDKPGLKVLDIGTGSGNIAVCLAKFIQDSNVTAVDFSESALKTAEENAKLLGAENVVFSLKDILKEDLAEKYDVIVSNPPYISSDLFTGLKPELKDYEPKGALTDFADGLTFYKAIAGKARAHLNEGGKLFAELGQGQFEDVKEIFEASGYENIQIKKDYQNIERIISGGIA